MRKWYNNIWPPLLSEFKSVRSINNFITFFVYPISLNTYVVRSNPLLSVVKTGSVSIRNQLFLRKLSLRRTYSTDNTVIPIKKYINADTEKLQILKDNKGKAGIYR